MTRLERRVFFRSLAIGALQIMLDRGEQKDWFGSPEIVIEAAHRCPSGSPAPMARPPDLKAVAGAPVS